MKDERKTKKQLIEDLTKVRKRVVKLEKSEAKIKQSEEALWESEEKYHQIVSTSS